MRVRDLKFQILICLVLIISYAGIAVCYYLPVRVKAESSMQTLAIEAAINEAKVTDDILMSYYEAFCNNSSTVTSIREDLVIQSKFGDSVVVFAMEKNFLVNSIDSNYYYFFYNPDSIDNKYGKVSLPTIYQNASLFDSFFVSSLGSIYYTNTDNTSSNMAALFNSSNFSIDSIIKEDKTFSQIVTIDGVRGVISGSLVKGGYYTVFIPIDSPYLAIDWVATQALMFYISGIIMLIAMLVVLIFGCKKASKLLRVERHTLEATKAIVIRVNKEGKVIFTNKTFKQLYGLKKLEDVSGFLDVETELPIIESIKERRAFECSFKIKDEYKYFHLSPLYVSSSYYLLGTDITIDYLRRKHLELMSGKNEITNCDNNFTLINEYNHIVLNSAFYDIAFIEYNIYKYEEIVGVFGRANFNTLLREFLGILQRNYGEYAIYHISDSKFIVVFPHVVIDDVNKKVDKTLEIFKRPISVNNNNIYVRCKVVTYNLKKDEARNITLDIIKDKLDLALQNIIDFQAKDYAIYMPQMDSILEQAKIMEEDLKRGLASDEFVMYLQPQYDVVANKITAFESLLRWINPKYENDSPQRLIELAEQRGYMLEIGRIVIQQSFDLAKKLENYGIIISINISPIQILQVGFANQLIEEASKRRLKPESIAIEITETFLMNNFQLVVEKLRILVQAGFHVHLDDFCTGYSSMLYLKELPVDTLKIDKGFTENMLIDKTSESIVKTISMLGNSLGLDIICEGIENEEQKELIKKMGCRIIQGYYISKAVSIDEAITLLEKYNTTARKKG